jgi:hypothetical protein
MGYSHWSDADYRRASSSRRTASSAEIFRGDKSIDPLMDPKDLTFREARDSEHHPHSVPIIVGFDVTGSMGDIPTRFAQSLLGALMNQLVERNWVTDPQLLFAAIGDAVSDRAPLQVGQFESGLEMDMWLTRIWLESGGGDLPESYTLAHWFAAYHTATDAWEKRKKKGYLFSIGDATNKPLQPSHIQRVFGKAPPASRPTDCASVIAAAQERYETFHILVTRGSKPADRLLDHWRQRVGDRLLVLDRTESICDMIGVTIGLHEGKLASSDAKSILVGSGMGRECVAGVIETLA